MIQKDVSGFKVDDDDEDEVLIRGEWGEDEAMMMMMMMMMIMMMMRRRMRLAVLIRGEWGEDEAMAALRSLTRPPLTPHNPNSALRLQSVVCKCLLYHIIRTLQKVLRGLSELLWLCPCLSWSTQFNQ